VIFWSYRQILAENWAKHRLDKPAEVYHQLSHHRHLANKHQLEIILAQDQIIDLSARLYWQLAVWQRKTDLRQLPPMAAHRQYHQVHLSIAVQLKICQLSMPAVLSTLEISVLRHLSLQPRARCIHPMMPWRKASLLVHTQCGLATVETLANALPIHPALLMQELAVFAQLLTLLGQTLEPLLGLNWALRLELEAGICESRHR